MAACTRFLRGDWARLLGATVLLGAACLGTGCADPKTASQPMEKSAYRIDPPEVREGSELTVDMLWNRDRCKRAFPNPERFDEAEFKNHEERIEACIPRVDRATGQVQMSFRLSQRDNANRLLMLPLEKKHVVIKHGERSVKNFEFKPYNPRRTDQLFVMLIDHSGSMREEDEEGVSRMQRVKNALWVNRKTFINQDAAVALFRFTNRLQGMEGQRFEEVSAVETIPEFKAELEKMGGGSGFTHLYRAMEKAVGPLLDKDTGVAKYLGGASDAVPTIVLLTDGFNNTRSDETCGDNAKQLEAALKAIKFARRKPPSKRPEVFTVGFGTGFRPGWTAEDDETLVTPNALCGADKKRRIDGDLDKDRIDNVSLAWLAKIGGGQSFVKSDYRELQKVFKETAPKRYVWYKVKYRVDPYYHRTSFDTRVEITQFVSASAAVTLHPSAWFDAPSGLRPDDESRWVEPGDLRRATAFTVPALAGFVLLTFLGPAMFNTRRALFRRAKKTSKK